MISLDLQTAVPPRVSPSPADPTDTNHGRDSQSRLRKLIEDVVADVFDVDADELRQPTRGRARIALARQVAMYIAHVGYELNLTDAGELFGRDRTTVAHACSVVEQRRDDPEFDRAIVLLELIVRALAGLRLGPDHPAVWRAIANRGLPRA